MALSLVLGANGQDGSYLTEALLARGNTVVGVGYEPESVQVKPSESYRYISADLRDAAAFAELVADAQARSGLPFRGDPRRGRVFL